MLNAKPTVKSTLKALLYLAPLLIITLIFTVWPLIHALLMSSYVHYNYFTNHVGALGWDNFIYLWRDPLFHLALRNTLCLVLVAMPLTVALALLIALGLNRIPWLARFFQTIYFLPFVTATIATGLVWNWIFRLDGGLLNVSLHHLGIPAVDWLNDPHYALLALIVVCVWQGLGFNVVLFLAGLNRLDDQYLHAAQLDGANAWQRFTNVTWPLLLPMTVLIIINTTVTTIKVFDQAFALFHGSAGPGNSALTLLFS
ncbi:carbohydrate ABC transporter permease [Levilactobacillus yiduensis]|uniref:carbohydrate ABC transporter permease n=1 Tax=Levilactobacillus yiduensis TaxID=2953880 RepID=UPI000EF35708|nr:sugar ABC transporter permease [Levilactobacillus yiduensis]AYM02304.1 sugar ABC transporter permease [Levilactobacillus brevis]